MLSRAPLALVVPCLASLFASHLAGCTPALDAEKSKVKPGGRLLHELGFALSDDGDPSTDAGSLAATFDSPVVNVDGSLESYGTAHVAFDDAARDVASATVLGAIAGSDLSYALLFDPDMPWRYVVVAAHAGALVADTTLTLDNDSAAALVVDEETGTGYLAASGALHISSATLDSGGRLVADLSAVLREVTLDAWPQNLFPFTEDGSELHTVTASGSGTFDAVWSERGELIGAASFSIEVESYGAFFADQASAMPLDDQSTVIVLASSVDPEHIVVALADTADFIAGAALSFDGFSSGAWLLASDGSQVAFTAGALSITAASLVEGGVVSGSLSIAGDGYVLPADEWSGEGEGEGEDEDCTGIDTLASDFMPAQVYLDEGFGAGELPVGYDRVLTFTDAGMGMMGLLVRDDVSFDASTPYVFDVVDYDGRPWPAAALGLATCSMMIEIAAGTLTAHIEDGRMTGELSYTVEGTTRALTLDVELLTQ